MGRGEEEKTEGPTEKSAVLGPLFVIGLYNGWNLPLSKNWLRFCALIFVAGAARMACPSLMLSLVNSYC